MGCLLIAGGVTLMIVSGGSSSTAVFLGSTLLITAGTSTITKVI